MALSPWHTAVSAPEELRSGRSRDASEFAVHLDRVRGGSGLSTGKQPDEFFACMFMTNNLSGTAVEIPWQKWIRFSMEILERFCSDTGLKTNRQRRGHTFWRGF